VISRVEAIAKDRFDKQRPEPPNGASEARIEATALLAKDPLALGDRPRSTAATRDA